MSNLPFTRLPKAQRKLGQLKEASVDFSNAKNGVHRFTEKYERRSSPFHRGASTTRTTTRTGDGKAYTNVSTKNAELTNLGKGTAVGGGVTAYGGALYAADRHDKNRSRRRNVRKNMSVSVWGVDHGDEVSKASNDRHKLTTGEKWGSGGLGGYYGAYKAKKGRKVAVGARMIGRAAAEGYGAGGALAGATHLATKGRNPAATMGAYYAGALPGGVHGNMKAYKNAKKRGDINGVKKSWEDVEKAFDSRRQQPSAGRRAMAALTPAPHGFVAGKQGSKLKAGFTQGGAAAGGGIAGRVAGGLATRGRPMGQAAGGAVGAVSGALGGNQIASNKGWLKPQKKKF